MNRIIEQELFDAVGEYLADQRPATYDAMEAAYAMAKTEKEAEDGGSE